VIELPEETPQERKRRHYVTFFKIALITSWFMMALGFGVIIYKIINR
jgi:hypothetical protein